MIVHGRLLRNPSNAELAAAIGLSAPSEPQASCDLLVVGSGPAGLSAAVYGPRKGCGSSSWTPPPPGARPGLVADRELLGFPSGISGAELAERHCSRRSRFARFAVPAEATSIEQDDGHYRVRLGDGTSLSSALVVLATGVRYRRLDVPRADYFEKMSIYYAASQAEALLCAGDPGGHRRRRQLGRAGGLPVRARHAGHAHRPRRRPGRAHVPLPHRPGHAYPERARHDQHRGPGTVRRPGPEAVTVADHRPARGAPSMPARRSSSSAWPCARAGFGGLVGLDDRGFVRTGPGLDGADRSLLETSQLGVFAIGDVRAGRPNGSPPPSARARWRSGSLSNVHAPLRR